MTELRLELKVTLLLYVNYYIVINWWLLWPCQVWFSCWYSVILSINYFWKNHKKMVTLVSPLRAKTVWLGVRNVYFPLPSVLCLLTFEPYAYITLSKKSNRFRKKKSDHENFLSDKMVGLFQMICRFSPALKLFYCVLPVYVNFRALKGFPCFRQFKNTNAQVGVLKSHTMFDRIASYNIQLGSLTLEIL